MSDIIKHVAKINPHTYLNIAKELNCDIEAVLAFLFVETPLPHIGDSQSGPLILNERHKFYRYLPTEKREDKRLTDRIYSRTPGGYATGRNWEDRQRVEHIKLDQKLAIDEKAALYSISMGVFQLMGFNHKMVGVTDVTKLWEDFEKLDDSIDGAYFVKFLRASKLAQYMNPFRPTPLAKGYNGANFKINEYDVKLAQFYKFLKRDYEYVPEPKTKEEAVKVKNKIIVPPEEYTSIVINNMFRIPIVDPFRLATGFPDFTRIEL